jgi:hypothetical protein
VFEDEHVLVGDPNNPPEELDEGQLMWDGQEVFHEYRSHCYRVGTGGPPEDAVENDIWIEV